MEDSSAHFLAKAMIIYTLKEKQAPKGPTSKFLIFVFDNCDRGIASGRAFPDPEAINIDKLEEIDTAAQTVEKIADTVGKVAEEVDKAAEDIAEALPEGGLKKVVSFVEDLAEETTKEAQRVEDLMDKVEELDDKLEAFLEKQSKGTEKA
ncbi:hypothetical protein DH2020_036124 [Rehmannia glutinosa]|uniref:Uncharacterized protein n=1 Tax=Rehmannia glutinosa TaxID=99300 RepID=A0ABR0V4Y0_REHGL